MYRVITAKVTFGNIHALDTYVEHVTTIKNSNSSLNRASFKTSDLNLQKSDSHTSLLSSGASSCDTNGANSSNSSGSETPTCIVDENAFKIPSNYKCTNYNMPEALNPSLMQASSAWPDRRANQHHHYGQVVDEDDILLQLAIQQSLASMNDEENQNDQSQVTALEALGHRPLQQIRDSTSRSTQSVEEYNARRGQLYAQSDEDLILQRVLAESLAQSETVVATLNETRPNLTDGDDALSRILELSRQEEEERKRRELEEEEQLKKILELSLLEK